MADDGPLSQADIDALTMGLLGNATDTVTVNLDALRAEAELVVEQGASILSTVLNKTVTLPLQDLKEGSSSELINGFESESLILRLPINSGLPGELCLVLKKETAALLCGLMLGGDGTAPYQDEDADALNELGNQYMGSLCTALGGHLGVSISAGQAQTSLFDPNSLPFGLEGAALIFTTLSVEGHADAAVRFILSPPLVAKLTGSSIDSSSSYDSEPSAVMASQSDLAQSLNRQLSDSPPNIQMLLDINLNVTIELGRTHLSIRKILELGPGSIIELDRLAGEPVDLLVNDKVVAKGEVVVVDEYFGIRIISLVSPEERIKQLK